MRARLPLLALLLLSSFWLAGCQLFQLAQLQAPIFHVQRVGVSDFSLAGVNLVATVEVSNPNNFAISLLPSTATVKVKGARLFDTALPLALNLPAGGHVVAPVSIQSLGCDPDLAALVAAQNDDVPCEVESAARFRTPVGELDIPLEFHGKLPMPQLPRVRFEGLHVSHISFTDASAEVQLSIDNANARPLAFEGIDARLMNGDRVLVHVRNANKPLLAPGVVTRFSIAVPMSFLADGPAILESLQSRGFDLRLVGTMRIGGKDLPIDERIDGGAP